MNALKLDLLKINEKHFLGKNGVVSGYAERNISIEELRVKHKALNEGALAYVSSRI